MAEARAIVFPTMNQAEIQSYTIPSLAPDELLVRTEYSGVSQGTEIWAYQGKRPELTYPTVPGYQSIGIIESAGASVHDFKIGQRIIFTSSRLPSHFPETWMAAHVSHAVVAVKEGFPVLVPDGVDPIAAALAALPAVSLRGIRMIDIGIGDLVVVTGQGLIGQGSAQLARQRGAIVISTDLASKRLQLSKENSADIAINPKETDLSALVKSIKPKGADAVIETSGRSDQFAPCIDLLRWEGSMLMQGYYPQPVTFEFHATHLKKPKIAVTCGFDGGELGTVLQLLKYNKLKIRPLATHVVPVAQAPDMYRRLAQGNAEMLGVVFDWGTK